LRIRREPNRHPRRQIVQTRNHRAQFNHVIGRSRIVFLQAEELPVLPNQNPPTGRPGIRVSSPISRHRSHLAHVHLISKLLRVAYLSFPSVAQLLNPIPLLLRCLLLRGGPPIAFGIFATDPFGVRGSRIASIDSGVAGYSFTVIAASHKSTKAQHNT
jgi:hypothetical protein